MRKNDPIAHIMATEVATVQQGQPLSDVYCLIGNHNIHHVPVLDGKKLVGLVSFTDIMKLNLALEGVDAHTLQAVIDQQFTLEGVMSTNLATITTGQTVRDAAEVLGSGEFHSLPIVNEAGELAGIVTSTDLIRYLSDQY
ncbi:CBS domain-containing protein [bacterium SCSIO 12696]|nr:CBS domain-containing protein [bacterium SCSIO 12696]